MVILGWIAAQRQAV